jgi:hypothetical protein
MARLTRARAFLALGTVATLAGCARQAPVAVSAAPEPTPARPELPAYLGAITPPAVGPDGSYQTINRGIDALQTMWHVRAALNVAAIGCRGTDGGTAIIASYNAMLTGEKKALDTANKSVEASFRARYGAAAWQSAHDAYMTRLYNFFAQPAAKPAFCAAAAPLATQAATTPPSEFAAFTTAALPQLEAPFIDVFRQVDNYHAAVAAWDARYGNGARTQPPVETAAAVAPVKHPRLAYADMNTVLDWHAPHGVALASR